MTIAIIIAVCIVLAILAFLVPRLSRHPQRGVNKTLSAGESVASSAPGKLGDWLAKPFQNSKKAANKSAEKGREGRSKAPV